MLVQCKELIWARPLCQPQFILADYRIALVAGHKLDKAKIKSFLETELTSGILGKAAKMSKKSSEEEEFKILPLRSLDDFILGSARFQVRCKF